MISSALRRRNTKETLSRIEKDMEVWGRISEKVSVRTFEEGMQ